MTKTGQSTGVIKLTGTVLDWNEEPIDECTISETEVSVYEHDGYSVTQIAGHFIAFRSQTPLDGDVTIQPKLDAGGRLAVAGGHANLGYSGYFKGYVFLGGKRKALVDFRHQFASDGSRYATQYLKEAAETAIRQKIAAVAGSIVTKVKGGYAFEPETTAARANSE